MQKIKDIIDKIGVYTYIFTIIFLHIILRIVHGNFEINYEISTIVLLALAMCVIENFMQSKKIYIIYKFIYILLAVFSIWLCFFCVSYNHKKNGILLISILIPSVYFFVNKMFQDTTKKIILIYLCFFITIFSCYKLSNMAAIFLSVTVFLYIFYCITQHIIKNKMLFLLIQLFNILWTIVLGTLLLACRLKSNGEFFYIKEFIRKANFIGKSDELTKEYIITYLKDYALTEFIIDNGLIVLIIYMVLIIGLFIKLLKYYKYINSFWIKSFIMTYILVLFIQVFFAVLMNCGYPLIRGYSLLFFDLEYIQCTNIFIVGIIQFMFKYQKNKKIIN